jgi:hypothetical protein
MRPNRIDGGLVNILVLAKLVESLGKGFAEQDIAFGELFGSGAVVQNHVHDSFLNALLEGHFAVLIRGCTLGIPSSRRVEENSHLQELKVHGFLWRLLAETTEGHVDTVHTSTTVHTTDDHVERCRDLAIEVLSGDDHDGVLIGDIVLSEIGLVMDVWC